MGLREAPHTMCESHNLFVCECVHSDTFKGGRAEQTQHEIPILKLHRDWRHSVIKVLCKYCNYSVLANNLIYTLKL